MSSSNDIIKDVEKSTKSFGRMILDEINIFKNVRTLYNDVMYGNRKAIFSSTIKVATNVIILYSLRKMMFPIMLAIAVFTIPKLFLKPKEKKSYIIETSGNEIIIIDRKDRTPLQF